MKQANVLTALILFVALQTSDWNTPRALAQLNDATLALFDKMIPQLDKELQTKFREAIAANHSWIEFSSEEFIRFRDNPANPFDGLNEIDPKNKPERIRLEFKIPSPRDRIPISREREHRSTLQAFDSAGAIAGASTARIICDGNWVALGTAVGANGLVLTKASELDVHKKIVCRFSVDGNDVDYPAKIFRSDDANDLALLKIDGVKLQPVQFDRRPFTPVNSSRVRTNRERLW